jgi:acyl carrier protein
VDDAPHYELSPERFENVFRPKVKGALLLDRATRGMELDFFVMFSSAAALLGSAGQGNYAAANACLDALAHFRHAQGLPTLSVNWGPWMNLGMTASAWNRQSARWEAAGVQTIRTRDGTRALDLLLASAQAQAAVLPVVWSRFVSRLPAGKQPLLALLTRRESASAALPASGKARLLDAPAAGRMDLLLDAIRGEIARVLGLQSIDAVDVDSRLFDLGIDSIMALELKTRLEREFDLRLPSTLLFDHPTPSLLAAYLSAELFGESPPAEAEQDGGETYTREELDRIIDEEYARAMQQSER